MRYKYRKITKIMFKEPYVFIYRATCLGIGAYVEVKTFQESKSIKQSTGLGWALLAILLTS